MGTHRAGPAITPYRRARGRSAKAKPTKACKDAARIAFERDAIWTKAARSPISPTEARFLLETEPAKRKLAHKYGARRVVVDGISFPSAAEAKRYGQLKMLERAGVITQLELQPRFVLTSIGTSSNFGPEGEVIEVGEYWADFAYIERKGDALIEVVEDVKGMILPLYRLKKKMFLAQYPHKAFREIKMKRGR